jgi:hypothetical protein
MNGVGRRYGFWFCVHKDWLLKLLLLQFRSSASLSTRDWLEVACDFVDGPKSSGLLEETSHGRRDKYSARSILPDSHHG